MAQPYDLSGIATVQAAVSQMLKDQKSGAVKFAGGFVTWVPAPTGWFKAILSSGGTPSPTTTNLVRISLRGVRTTLDLLAGGTGSVAANVVQASTPPTLLLEAGKLPTGPTTATGPLVNPPLTVANTSYDLSGIVALQTTVNQMLADQQARVTSFVGWGETWKGKGRFLGIMSPGGTPQTITMGDVLSAFGAIQAQFDQLGTTGAKPPGIFVLDQSLLDGIDILA